MQNIYEVQSANRTKSFLVVAGFFLFVLVAIYFISQAMAYYFGYEPGGLGSVGLAFIVSGAMSFGSYWWSDKIVLGLSGARPADRKRDFTFFTVTENLAIGAGIPKPKLYVIDDSAPNAFATGRDPHHAAVCATTGLLDKLNRSELEGVIAHEATEREMMNKINLVHYLCFLELSLQSFLQLLQLLFNSQLAAVVNLWQMLDLLQLQDNQAVLFLPFERFLQIRNRLRLQTRQLPIYTSVTHLKGEIHES